MDVGTGGIPIGKYLVDSTGTSGVVMALGNTGQITSSNVSMAKWLSSGSGVVASTKMLNRYTYVKFLERMKDTALEVDRNIITNSTIDLNNIISNPKMVDGVIYAQVKDAGVTISSGNVGSKKVVLFVDGTVNITGKISYTSGGGMVAIFAKDDINIDPTVGETTYHTTSDLMGIFFAGGVINTGSNGTSRDEYLRIKGSVVGMGGVNLERSVIADGTLGANPAEYFEYDPATVMLMPKGVLRRHIVTEQVIP